MALRPSAAALLALSLLGGAVAAAPAAAETDPNATTSVAFTPDPTDPSTAPPTSPPAEPSISTTSTSSSPTTTSTAPAEDTSTTSTASTTSTVLLDDPLANEEQGEDAPAVDVTIPPKGLYGDQDVFAPPGVLWSSVAKADQKLAELQGRRREAIGEIRILRLRRKQLLGEQSRLGAETRDAIDRVAMATERLQARSIARFRQYGTGDPFSDTSVGLDYARIVELQRKSKMVGAAVDVDQQDLADLAHLRAALNEGATAIVERIRILHETLADAETVAVELALALDQARIEYEAFKAGSEIFIDGVDFPIGGPYSPVTDSFGAPRMPGTPDEHWHEGIDIFAPRGTPLVATERGIITRVGVGRLGGLKFWLKGESGAEWYYAHLDSFAPGLVDGLMVDAGQLVGYVGNTGNAVGTPPHLHMELHPNGERPVNPYPLLKVVSDLERAAIAAGTHPGHPYEPYVAGRLAEQAAQTNG